MTNHDIPTLDEIASLPRLARIALAARSARRAFRFLEGARRISEAHTSVLFQAVALAEEVASGKRSSAAAASSASSDSSSVAHQLAFERPQQPSTGALVADATSAASRAAAPEFENDKSLGSSHTAIELACRAAASLSADAAEETKRAIRLDLEMLRRASSSWDDSTPVPPGFFGPMWPEGTAAKGKVVEVNVEARLTVHSQATAEVSESQPASQDWQDFEVRFDPALSDNDIAFVLEGLRELYQVHGGLGFEIKLDREEAKVPAGKEVPR